MYLILLSASSVAKLVVSVVAKVVIFSTIGTGGIIKNTLHLIFLVAFLILIPHSSLSQVPVAPLSQTILSTTHFYAIILSSFIDFHNSGNYT